MQNNTIGRRLSLAVNSDAPLARLAGTDVPDQLLSSAHDLAEKLRPILNDEATELYYELPGERPALEVLQGLVAAPLLESVALQAQLALRASYDQSEGQGTPFAFSSAAQEQLNVLADLAWDAHHLSDDPIDVAETTAS